MRESQPTATSTRNNGVARPRLRGEMPAQPPVLVFDVNETLIDIDSIAPFFGELFGDEKVLREWFGQLVMYSMAATLAERYVDFFALGQGVLRMLADIYWVARHRRRCRAPTRTDADDASAPRCGRRPQRVARQRLSSGDTDEFTALAGHVDTTRECRARWAFRASAQRRIRPCLQTVTIGVPARLPGAGCGARRVHDGGGPCLGYPRRSKCGHARRSHHPAGQPTAPGRRPPTARPGGRRPAPARRTAHRRAVVFDRCGAALPSPLPGAPPGSHRRARSLSRAGSQSFSSRW